LVFASRNTPIFKFNYSVQYAKYRYSFVLQSFTCLKQSKWSSPDRCYAQVEFNYSPYNIVEQHKNVYWLGTFQNHEVSNGYCSHHCSFNSYGTFCIKFYTQNLVFKHSKISTWVFKPITTTTPSSNNSNTISSIGQQQQQQQQLLLWHHKCEVEQQQQDEQQQGNTNNDYDTINIQDILLQYNQQQQQQQQQLNYYNKKDDNNTNSKYNTSIITCNSNNYEIFDFSNTNNSNSNNSNSKPMVIKRRIEIASKGNHHRYAIEFIIRRDEIQLPIKKQMKIRHLSLVNNNNSNSINNNSKTSYHSVIKVTSDYLQNIITSTDIQNMNYNSNNIAQDEEQKQLPSSSNTTTNPVSCSSSFSKIYNNNLVEILIDGTQTFARYYHYMMQAKYSIDIVGWELSLSFGLVYVAQAIKRSDQFTRRTTNKLLSYYGNFANFANFSSIPNNNNTNSNDTIDNWITLEQVLLAKAASGVKIRVMIWRHHIMSYLNRYLYMGEVTIEREVYKLQKKAAQMGLRVLVFHTEFNLPDAQSPYADPFNITNSNNGNNAHMVFVIVGNPKGMISCHHEKMVLVDIEHSSRAVAFIGGFDIARGRFDDCNHEPPKPFWDMSNFFNNNSNNINSNNNDKNNSNSNDSKVKKSSNNSNNHNNQQQQQQQQQSFLISKTLWHDQQALLRGPATRPLLQHFAQRWIHAFTSDSRMVRLFKLSKRLHNVIMRDNNNNSNDTPMIDYNKDDNNNSNNNSNNTNNNSDTSVALIRSWPGLFDSTNLILDSFNVMIQNAQDYIYMEHQYPFQNAALTQVMIDALKSKPKLKLIVITPVKTDLPTGFVGDLIDMSQDHIIDHLNLIYQVAPDRVGIYGLVKQDSHKTIKTIYVHSKFVLVDDKLVCIGSANIDNVSFYKSSELNMLVYNSRQCIDSKRRLVHEHLGYYNSAQFDSDFTSIVQAFKHESQLNVKSLKDTGLLCNRVFPMMPLDLHQLICNVVSYPSPIAKMMFKLGWSPHKYLSMAINNLEQSVMSNSYYYKLQDEQHQLQEQQVNNDEDNNNQALVQVHHQQQQQKILSANNFYIQSKL